MIVVSPTNRGDGFESLQGARIPPPPPPPPSHHHHHHVATVEETSWSPANGDRWRQGVRPCTLDGSSRSTTPKAKQQSWSRSIAPSPPLASPPPTSPLLPSSPSRSLRSPLPHRDVSCHRNSFNGPPFSYLTPSAPLRSVSAPLCTVALPYIHGLAGGQLGGIRGGPFRAAGGPAFR